MTFSSESGKWQVSRGEHIWLDSSLHMSDQIGMDVISDNYCRVQEDSPCNTY